MVDPGKNFGGYMDDIAEAQAEAAADAEMLNAHEEWRQTTWGGWIVRKLQAIADHFHPFLSTALDLMNDEDNVTKVFIMSIIRLVIIFIFISLVYGLARIIQKIIGSEYELEEEVVIVHEHETQEEANKAAKETDTMEYSDSLKQYQKQQQTDQDKADATKTSKKKGKRDKKQKSA